MNLREIAEKLGCKLVGDGEVEITGVAGMERAGASELTFLANPKYARKVKDSRATKIFKRGLGGCGPCQHLAVIEGENSFYGLGFGGSPHKGCEQ